MEGWGNGARWRVVSNKREREIRRPSDGGVRWPGEQPTIGVVAVLAPNKLDSIILRWINDIMAQTLFQYQT